MELFAFIVRYAFVAALAVEIGILGYTFVSLARDKARPAEVVVVEE